ncbi:MAG: hypothetical protein AAF218_11175 [Pseudomonadota bacterium]
MRAQTADKVRLRWGLRSDTAAAHAALDQAVSAFDLSKPLGLARFLHMQALALGSLQAAGLGGRCAGLIGTLNGAARADLDTLGAPTPQATAVPPFEALAVDYVVSGALLGSKILTQRWRASADPAVQRAGQYFGATRGLEAWRDFQEDAARISAHSARADRICRDAAGVFALFQRAATDDAQ